MKNINGPLLLDQSCLFGSLWMRTISDWDDGCHRSKLRCYILDTPQSPMSRGVAKMRSG